jgi:hypothetical protein
MLEAPGMYVADRAKGKDRRRRASWCRRNALAEAEVVEPLLIHAQAAVLSDPNMTLWWVWAEVKAAKDAPTISAASSRSFIDTDPSGLSLVTKVSWMCVGKAERQRQCSELWPHEGNQTPPMPCWEASVMAIMEGGVGTKVCSFAGTVWMSSNRVCQSRSTALTRGVRRSRFLQMPFKACCRIENRCGAPYKAGVELRRTPNKWRHFFTEVRFVCWNVDKRLLSEVRRCAGKDSCIFAVSTSQPRMHFLVEKVASPFFILFSEIAWRRGGEGSLSKTESIACIN